MIQYVIEVIVIQALFMAVYEFLLKRESFFSENRIYLLMTPLLAFVLPFIEFDSLTTVLSKTQLLQLPSVFISENASVQIEDSKTVFSLWTLFWIAGSIVSLVYFLYRLRQLFSLRSQAMIMSYDGVDYYSIPKSTEAFSFLNAIYLGDEISAEHREHILAHEMIHVNDKHTIDLLLFEILKIVMWFNPCFYIFQKKLATLHEYIADNKVTIKNPKTEYYEGLLSQAFHVQRFSFTNTFFNHSLIKKRILMLHKSKSKTMFKLKYLAVIPLILVFVLYTSCSEVKEEGQDASQDLTTTQVSEDSRIGTEDDIPFAHVERIPAFPECNGDKAEMKTCVSQRITEYFLADFDTKLANKLGLTGVQKIYVAFKIDKTGNVVDVRARAAHKQLADEAKRIVEDLPQFIPGQQDGENVGVLYSLPVVFRIEE